MISLLLADIKLLLGITDNSQDELLRLYIRRATYNVKTYLNTDKYTDVEIGNNFPEAIITLVVNGYQQGNSTDKGIKTKSQGARSVTYMDGHWLAVNDEVRALLPTPYVKMR